MISNSFDNLYGDDYEARLDEAIHLAGQREETLAWANTHELVSEYEFEAGDFPGSAWEAEQAIECEFEANEIQGMIEDLGFDLGFDC